MSIGVPKSAKAFINTRSAPASTVGKISGIIIVTTFLTALQPRLSAASLNETSIFFNAPDTYIQINGQSFKVNTNKIPPNPYTDGISKPNKLDKNLVTTPLLPHNKIQEYAPMNGGESIEIITSTSISPFNLIL